MGSWCNKEVSELSADQFWSVIISILKSLVIFAIWLALIGAIISRIAPFFSLNHIFFSANMKTLLKHSKQLDFKALFEYNFWSFLQTSSLLVQWNICTGFVLIVRGCFNRTHNVTRRVWINHFCSRALLLYNYNKLSRSFHVYY